MNITVTSTTIDKAAVASSLKQSAMASAVKVPRGFDYAAELDKVRAHLAAQGRHRRTN